MEVGVDACHPDAVLRIAYDDGGGDGDSMWRALRLRRGVEVGVDACIRDAV